MSEVKTSDPDRNWQPVDIYIFSNGQHMTPPRKYHLDPEGLSRWNSTLSTLARSQYGSLLRSIDLYTTEGQRVYTPVDISDGSAYVAVPPDDSFIPAGYNDYLLRASKSREKRQCKAKSNVQLEPQQEELDGKIQEPTMETKEEVGYIETLNEKDNNAASSIIENQTNPQSKMSPQTKNKDNVKQSIRTNSTIRRNSLTPQQSSIRKTSIKLKDSPLKKNLKVYTTEGANNGSINNSNNQSRDNSLEKKTVKCTEKATPRNSNERPKIIVISPTEKTKTVSENGIDDRDLIIVKKQESENRSQMFSEFENKSTHVVANREKRISSVVPILMPIEEKSSSIGKEDPPAIPTSNLVGNDFKPDKDDINTNIFAVKNDIAQETQEEKIKLIMKPTVDNLVTLIDKGDVVNLNLKLEVRKCAGLLTTQDKQKNSISEKSSQVNIEHEIIEKISKRSNLTNKSTDGEENPRVVVIQCSCCGHLSLNDILHKIDIDPVKLHDKKYVVVLPDPQLDKSVERNGCRQEQYSNVVSENNASLSRSSVAAPVKKVMATTSLERLIALASAVEESGIKTPTEPKTQDKPEVVSINHTSTISSVHKLYQVDSSCLQSETSTKCKQITFADDSTQTDWHTVLLEARRHEDGRYSFYLPPLHVLKYYGYS